jgi:hypothetical protein
MASDAEILAAVKTAIYNLVSSGEPVMEFTVAGRATKYYSLDELQRLEAYYGRKTASASHRRIRLLDVSRGDS